MNACVALTVFAVMFGIGLGVAPREWREAWRKPGPMLRALSAVLVVVPALALAVTRMLDLPRWAEIGIVLMAISPGAPVALRRSLAAGGLPAFASSLQRRPRAVKARIGRGFLAAALLSAAGAACALDFDRYQMGVLRPATGA